jgi:hypothetical protein
MARTTDPAPDESAPEPVACPKPDPFAGVGGEYVLDMTTGERKPKTEKI